MAITARFQDASQDLIIALIDGREYSGVRLSQDGDINRRVYDWVAAGGQIAAFEAPAPTVDDVRTEAQRRIVGLTGARDLQSCVIKQLNALMRVGELNDKQARGEALSPTEQAEAGALRSLAAAVKAIRAASNILEASPPADYASNTHWPA